MINDPLSVVEMLQGEPSSSVYEMAKKEKMRKASGESLCSNFYCLIEPVFQTGFIVEAHCLPIPQDP